MLQLVKKLGLALCYRCKNTIDDYKKLSIDHTEGWQLSKNPIKAFFDLEKIAFSHLQCNIRAKRIQRTNCRKGHEFLEVGFYTMKNGKRLCKECNKLRVRLYRSRLRSRGVTEATPVLETGASNSV